MIRKFCSLVLTLSIMLVLVSCGKGKYGEYGYRISEDLETLNIIDDNIDNYYEIFVRSFYDSDGNGIGDLQGVIKKLDYISDLGFTGIWLMPINKSSSYHKYNVDDYYQIDPLYGTMEDFEQLIAECHKRDIKLIIDLVLNHSGYNNPLFKKAVNAHEKELAGFSLNEEEEKYKDFFTFFDSKNDIPKSITTYPIRNGLFYYEGNFSSEMPELNYDNPYVYEEVKNIMKFYLDKGLDGFRLDAVKYFYFNNHTKNVEVLRKINQMAKEINPKCYIVGECWDADAIISQYYTSGIDSFFNFPGSVTNPNGYIMNGVNREGDALKQYYEGMLHNIALAKDCIPAPFIDNHDTVRFTSTRDYRKSKFQYALLSMLNGNTFTYYGDEVGMVGSKEVDQNVRIPILWGEENEEGDCTVISGVTTNELTRYIYPTVSEQISDEESFYNFYKKCNLIRNQNPEIARGNIELVVMDRDVDKLLFISKEYNGSKIGIIFNFSPYYDLSIYIKQYGYNQVIGQIVVDNSLKYIGELKDGSIKMPSYSIAIVK